eukprot:435054-Amphidinium_carterae.2
MWPQGLASRQEELIARSSVMTLSEQWTSSQATCDRHLPVIEDHIEGSQTSRGIQHGRYVPQRPQCEKKVHRTQADAAGLGKIPREC